MAETIQNSEIYSSSYCSEARIIYLLFNLFIHLTRKAFRRKVFKRKHFRKKAFRRKEEEISGEKLSEGKKKRFQE